MSWEKLGHRGQKLLASAHVFPVSSHCLLPLVLQEQKCAPASGELSPDLQEGSPYSPGHSSRHSNPPFYASRASVGELAGQGWGEGQRGLTGPPSLRQSGGGHFRELLHVLSRAVQKILQLPTYLECFVFYQ